MLNSLQNGRFSFIFTILLVHATTPTISTKILFSTSVNFHLPIPPLCFTKIILTIPTNTPFLYAAAIFHLPVFAYNDLSNLNQKHFLYLIRLTNSQCVKVQRSYRVLISPFFLKVWTAIAGLTVHITQAQKIGMLQAVVSDEDACNWNGKPSNPPFLIPSIQSLIHTLQIPSQDLAFLDLFKLIFILNLAFSYSIHAPLYPSINFFYISLLKSLNLVLFSGTKLDAHLGTWIGFSNNHQVIQQGLHEAIKQPFLIKLRNIRLKNGASFVDTAQKMKFSIKCFFSKYDQICRKLWNCIFSLKKSLMENFVFCAVWLSISRKYESPLLTQFRIRTVNIHAYCVFIKFFRVPD